MSKKKEDGLITFTTTVTDDGTKHNFASSIETKGVSKIEDSIKSEQHKH